MALKRLGAYVSLTASLVLVACSSGSNNGNSNSATKAPAASAAAATSASSPAAGAAPATAQSIGVGTSPAAAAAQKVKTGGTLNIGLARDATNLDSAKSQDAYSGYVQAQIVEPLFIATNDFKVAGNLVDKVDNPDDVTYLFHLHPGINFQDGTPFDATAVKWNLQRHIDDKTSVRNGDVKPITAMDVVDPMTLKITVNAPYAPFLSKLAGGAGYMYSPATYQKAPDKIASDLTGAGTGPYKFTEWKRDNQITLDRNPNYWRKDENGVQYPYLDKLVMKPIPDENTRLTSLKTGDLDFIETPPPKDLKAIQSTPDLVYKQAPGIDFNFMMLETEKEPFNDKRVRQALAYAIDRQTIVDTVYFGTRVTADTEIPGSVAGSVNGPYMKRDVAKAKDLLKQAGKEKVAVTLQFSNASPVLQQVGELTKDEATEAGFDISLQPLEFATVVDNANKGNYQAGLLGWSGSVDPDGFVSSLFKSDAGFNLAHYKSTAVDDLIVKGQQTLDHEKRTPIYKQLMGTLADDEPFIVYSWGVLQQTTRKNVQNFQLGPAIWPLLYKVWKS